MKTRHSLGSLSLAAALCALLSPACVWPAAPPPSEIDDLAARLIPLLQRASKKPKKIRVVVADFYSVDGNDVGLQLALPDALSEALMRSGAPLEVIDRRRFTEARIGAKLPVEEVRFQDIAEWLARAVGAECVVTGRVKRSEDKISVTVAAANLLASKTLGEMRIELSADELLSSYLAVAAPATNHSFEEAVTLPDKLYGQMAVKYFNGIRYPRCKQCGPPQYSEEARRKRVEGSVLLQVLIGTDGRVSGVRILKARGDGLTAAAVRAVLSWEFDPARNSEGKAVPSLVPIEITFRLV